MKLEATHPNNRGSGRAPILTPPSPRCAEPPSRSVGELNSQVLGEVGGGWRGGPWLPSGSRAPQALFWSTASGAAERKREGATSRGWVLCRPRRELLTCFFTLDAVMKVVLVLRLVLCWARRVPGKGGRRGKCSVKGAVAQFDRGAQCSKCYRTSNVTSTSADSVAQPSLRTHNCCTNAPMREHLGSQTERVHPDSTRRRPTDIRSAVDDRKLLPDKQPTSMWPPPNE